MTTGALKYASPFIIYLGSLLSFTGHGFVIWIPVIYAWIVIPVSELFLKPNPRNMSTAEEEFAVRDKTYDIFLYLAVVFQFVALYIFLHGIKYDSLTWIEIIGRVWVMGLLCGTFGINIGHELGHRISKPEQTMAKMLLLSSLYMHFFIEHNKGHHKRVATPEDPGSARFGESVYSFYVRSIILSYFSAWKIANQDTIKKRRPVISFFNEMIQFHLIQGAFILIIFFVFGWFPALCFLVAALTGILLLETVNYIEHYGLQRKSLGEGKYERAMPAHSWNSDHMIGRLMLFELSRHSDHHYLASRKYQVLRHHDDSPQMPTGYPGMMILSLFPPAWFHVMDSRIKKMETRQVTYSLQSCN